METIVPTINEVIISNCQEILKKYHVRNITCDDNNGDVYTIDASPYVQHTFHGLSICNDNYNRKYKVSHSKCTDGNYDKIWKCNCRAGQNNYNCNHVNVVIEIHKYLTKIFGWQGFSM